MRDDERVIIDCHGHYTTVPESHNRWREAQTTAFAEGTTAPRYPAISDDEIRDSLESSQLKLIRERGTDLTLFSPRASAMAHHVGDELVSRRWAEVCNDMIARVVGLYPETYLGCAQLPQSPGAPLDASVDELRRAVNDLGFVGAILNPDPSGGYWLSPRLTDEYWYPIYETLVELDVPAMIHPSAAANPVFHGTGDHYINADTTVFMQLVQGTLFERFPTLRFVIPHGGGAVPYHWGRYRGLADMLSRPPIESTVVPNVYFDTCVYHQPGIDLLFETVPHEHLLFGSEMVGAVRGIDPKSGCYFDDTRRYVDKVVLDDDDRAAVMAGNARRVFPGVDAVLRARGL